MTSDPLHGRYVNYHYWGGLGDVLYMMRSDRCRYNFIAEFRDRDRAVVIVTSPNLNARELFDCHPNADKIKVTFNAWDSNTGPHPKSFLQPWMHHIPQMYFPQVEDRLIFHPTPKDQQVLDEIGGRPYIVVAPTAAGRPRCFPDWLTQKIIRAILKRGFLPVFVGASYKVHGSYPYKVKKPFHGEPEHNEDGVFSVINRLSVPGSLYAVGQAAGVISCYSAMCVGAYVQNRSQLIITSDQVMENVESPTHHLKGIDLHPECTMIAFQDPCLNKAIDQYIDSAVQQPSPQLV